MSAVLPGFYFDEAKQRYFPLRASTVNDADSERERARLEALRVAEDAQRRDILQLEQANSSTTGGRSRHCFRVPENSFGSVQNQPYSRRRRPHPTRQQQRSPVQQVQQQSRYIEESREEEVVRKRRKKRKPVQHERSPSFNASISEKNSVASAISQRVQMFEQAQNPSRTRLGVAAAVRARELVGERRESARCKNRGGFESRCRVDSMMRPSFWVSTVLSRPSFLADLDVSGGAMQTLCASPLREEAFTMDILTESIFQRHAFSLVPQSDSSWDIEAQSSSVFIVRDSDRALTQLSSPIPTLAFLAQSPNLLVCVGRTEVGSPIREADLVLGSSEQTIWCCASSSRPSGETVVAVGTSHGTWVISQSTTGLLFSISRRMRALKREMRPSKGIQNAVWSLAFAEGVTAFEGASPEKMQRRPFFQERPLALFHGTQNGNLYYSPECESKRSILLWRSPLRSMDTHGGTGRGGITGLLSVDSNSVALSTTHGDVHLLTVCTSGSGQFQTVCRTFAVTCKPQFFQHNLSDCALRARFNPRPFTGQEHLFAVDTIGRTLIAVCASCRNRLWICDMDDPSANKSREAIGNIGDPQAEAASLTFANIGNATSIVSVLRTDGRICLLVGRYGCKDIRQVGYIL